LDNPAPIGGDPIPERDGIGWLRHIGLRIGKLADTPIDLAPLVEAGSYSHAVAHLARALTAARILPADLDPDHLARFVEVYRTNAVSAAHYRPPALATPIPTAVYRARLRDKELETSETTDSALSDTLGWETLLPCPPRAFNVSGTHLTMFNPPHVADLARTLSAHLRAVEARGRETATAMAEDAE
jgi:thioesterase domain-containing protein